MPRPATRLTLSRTARPAAISDQRSIRPVSLTGLARRAVEEAVEACGAKLLVPDGILLIDRPATLETIAKAEASTRSARAFLTEEIQHERHRRHSNTAPGSA